ncbi:dihydrolipoamide acetyltransferase family protein [Nocardioides sp. AX2bis]|uniref:dihydrolipoamide acetyltransferase family protein n=1 Tax=Nocardioides sp. AX2bis TaxID=2653157 RepID=UPI0012F0750C|nr:dihydrolipoamide acetyltransferase family protein [Nocardioides sp. AX2bis]VXB96233.1 Dihydrolipoyllysine-residue acetyltransferase component of pyruvate dehydrogenase complex [Nocardioides sp. AX2bis]
MAEYKLPDPGEGLTEAEIVTWRVKVGDTVEINDVVVEIETAKSLVELPSPYAGTVVALLADEGQMVEVGTPIIRIVDPAEAAASVADAPPAPTAEMEIDLSNPAASGGGEGESLVGRNKADRGPVRRRRKGAASPSTEAGANTQMQLQGAFAPGGAMSDEVVASDEPAVPATSARGPEPEAADALVPARATSPQETRVLAKPPVRKMAKDLGVDLTSLTASGPGGTVTREDVQSAASGRGAAPAGVPAPAPAADAPRAAHAGARETREPVKGVRKMMAGAMVGSAFSAPHVTEWVTVDVTAAMELVERLQRHRSLRDVKVGPLLVLARAVTLAVRRTPEINSWWDEAAQEVVVRHYVNLGIAAATPRGLVVPNVKDADAMSLHDLAAALGELTATAREGRTTPAAMSGGTFTITNVGVFGVDAGTPIINPGESAILCFGAIRKQPWVVTRDGVDEIVPRQVTTLALSFDHRHVDGQMGSRFLADVAGILEDPGSALLF